ncbi:MAG: hypothetical protein HFJ75_06215 [Eggerthellaceae bacterium]|nr:hypothetical protein [Eggerthellaceae bacterium]
MTIRTNRYAVSGTSALKAEAEDARIISFPGSSTRPRALRTSAVPQHLSSRQTVILFAIGCALSFGSLFLSM